ncbi:hypothetical protein B296_00052682 [Ensete ventricosum]|uniref:Uncharacterized protein n=1 Tax=Ensete ventricosum TaxID=4639 RepID=A0A426XZU1_ENSVE|nr:hypothetical protein B296_00052682 [Ensete ventricosum]
MFCFRLTQKDEDGARVHHARGGQNRSKTTAAPLQHCHSYSLATLLTYMYEGLTRRRCMSPLHVIQTWRSCWVRPVSPRPSRAQTAATRGGGGRNLVSDGGDPLPRPPGGASHGRRPAGGGEAAPPQCGPIPAGTSSGETRQRWGAQCSVERCKLLVTKYMEVAVAVLVQQQLWFNRNNYGDRYFRQEIRNERRKRKEGGSLDSGAVFPISAVEDPIKLRVPVLFFLLPQSKAPSPFGLSLRGCDSCSDFSPFLCCCSLLFCPVFLLLSMVVMVVVVVVCCRCDKEGWGFPKPEACPCSCASGI